MTAANTGLYVAPPAPATSQQQSPLGQYTAPSLTLPQGQLQTGRGICTLQAPNQPQLQFRTNPNDITWDYSLLTHVEQTYGGRVVQILGVKMDNLRVTVDCGQGGWPYAMYIVQYMRDLMVNQRDGNPATFTYTTRNWQLKVFAQNVPFHDSVTETVRELELQFTIQEDVSGVMISASLSDALNALQDGIGWVVSMFNNYSAGSGSAPNNAAGGGPYSALQSSVAPLLASAITGPPTTGIPGVGSFSSLLGGIIPGL